MNASSRRFRRGERAAVARPRDVGVLTIALAVRSRLATIEVRIEVVVVAAAGVWRPRASLGLDGTRERARRTARDLDHANGSVLAERRERSPIGRDRRAADALAETVRRDHAVEPHVSERAEHQYAPIGEHGEL